MFSRNAVHGPFVRLPSPSSLLGLASLIVVGACADQLPSVAAPVRGAPRLSADAGPASHGSDTVRCEIAGLLADGSYKAAVALFRVGPDLGGASAGVVKFAVRNWAADRSDPTRVVACELPNTTGALRRFQEIFGVSDRAASLNGIYARGGLQPGAMFGGEMRASSRSTDPTAMVYDQTECLQYDACACPPEAISCDTSTGEWEGPPPPDENEPSFSVGSLDQTVTPIVCRGTTDWPHLSGTEGYAGYVNVHGTTQCPIALPISVSTTLDRQRCFWFICWWSTMGSGYKSAVDVYIRDNASGPCYKGYWIGTSYHTVVFPSGQIGSGTSRGWSYIGWCW